MWVAKFHKVVLGSLSESTIADEAKLGQVTAGEGFHQAGSKDTADSDVRRSFWLIQHMVSDQARHGQA